MYYSIQLYSGNGFVILGIRVVHYTFYKLCFI
nr:MAG TPA: hypothetical protein [Bacteriophage sp.]